MLYRSFMFLLVYVRKVNRWKREKTWSFEHIRGIQRLIKSSFVCDFYCVRYNRNPRSSPRIITCSLCCCNERISAGCVMRNWICCPGAHTSECSAYNPVLCSRAPLRTSRSGNTGNQRQRLNNCAKTSREDICRILSRQCYVKLYDINSAYVFGTAKIYELTFNVIVCYICDGHVRKLLRKQAALCRNNRECHVPRKIFLFTNKT